MFPSTKKYSKKEQKKKKETFLVKAKLFKNMYTGKLGNLEHGSEILEGRFTLKLQLLWEVCIAVSMMSKGQLKN